MRVKVLVFRSTEQSGAPWGAASPAVHRAFPHGKLSVKRRFENPSASSEGLTAAQAVLKIQPQWY